MPRPLLNQKQGEAQALHLHTAPTKEIIKDPQQRDRLLRKTRSARYIEALCRLDAGGATMCAAEKEAILAEIRAAFPDLVEMRGELIGIVAKCYLGKPYEVHTLTLANSIIEHYKMGEALPDGMEKARALALRGGYALVEVYTDACRAISEDGSVSVVRV